MPRFLNTTGRATLAIAVCDRCHEKVSLDDLHEDRDKPGLRVCDACNDQYDPYKLSARMTEDITLRYPRPDEPIEVPQDE